MIDIASGYRIGAVVIGRNEGQRLGLCLASVINEVAHLVYVDSGSTDGSVAVARTMGAEVVELDTAIPFTAARARNAGIERLLHLQPDTAFVQVIDGDCEVAKGWLKASLAEILSRPVVAIVFGRRRERHRERTIYNRLCDMEWQKPIGPAKSCGGDALIRVQAFKEVGGYSSSLIAGEEPELCFRLRQRGWDIRCIEYDMTFHDAAIVRFSQFWKRTVRAGHAYAENAWLHGHSSAECHSVQNVLSSLFWGVALPGLTLALVWPSRGVSLFLLLVGYATLFSRVRRFRIRQGNTHFDALIYAGFICLAKFIESIGIMKFLWNNKVLRRRPMLIEYKSSS